MDDLTGLGDVYGGTTSHLLVVSPQTGDILLLLLRAPESLEGDSVLGRLGILKSL